MKGLCVVRLEYPQERCSCGGPETELCTCQGVDGDAVRMVTLSQLWGAAALGRSRHPAISGATSSGEFRAIGRLRYRLFVKHGSENSAHANHAEGWFLEPVDATSLNLWAGPERRCLAALRLTQGADAVCDARLATMLRQSALPEAEHPTCLVLSRLAIRDEARARPLIPALARQAYRIGLETGAGMALIAASPADAPAFARLGFQPSGTAWTEPGQGELRCMTLAMRDRANLEAAGSPLLAELDAFIAAGPEGTSDVSILNLDDEL